MVIEICHRVNISDAANVRKWGDCRMAAYGVGHQQRERLKVVGGPI